MHYLHIALPLPFRQTFDYLPPEDFSGSVTDLAMGVRVKVTFNMRPLIGILVGIGDSASIEPEKIKAAECFLDEQPLFDDELISLCRWVSDYYQHPLGETLHTALPQTLRKGVQPELHEKQWELTREGHGLPENALKRSVKQQKVIQYLLKNRLLSDADVGIHGLSRQALNALEAKGLTVSKKRPKTAGQLPQQLLAERPLTLNDEQQHAIAQIRYHEFGCYLLEGATGSGKTEVYLHAIARTLQAGKQVLVLIPEIGLTPQTVGRIQKRFNISVAELHSSVSQKKRERDWISAATGVARVIIGTRLAALSPAPDLGLIIIDEEHDLSFKQQDGLRYSARDICVYRAKKRHIPVVLGSATPSLESLNNALEGRFHHLTLHARAGEALPPTKHLIDLRGTELLAGLAPVTLSAIEKTLSAQQQALIFVSRRGYAPALQCHYCGWTAQCRACDQRMTIHSRPHHLRCHHCGSQRPLVTSCQHCGSQELISKGLGTEQLEEVLAQHFEGTPVLRIDSDSMRTSTRLKETLSAVRQGQPCILVGTQMLAKGHHLPKVTLVVVVDIDQLLMSPDFRGPERMAQLITQVSGRSGREQDRGRVLIQSHRPEHPLIKLLLDQGYHAYALAQLAERQQNRLPPFCYIALFRAEAKRADNALALLRFIHSTLKSMPDYAQRLRTLGPLPSPLEKINHRYRFQYQLSFSDRSTRRTLLNKLLPAIEANALAKRTRWSLDIDPQET